MADIPASAPAEGGVGTIASTIAGSDPCPDNRLPGGIARMPGAGFVQTVLPWDELA